MKLINCDLCGSKNHFFLFKGKDYLHNIPGEFNIVKCTNCNLVFINPQPSQKELEKYYPKKYFTHFIKKNNFKEKIRKIIYKTYHGPKNNLFLKLLFFPYHHLRGIPYKKNGKVLDIGCGNGRFLLDCKKLGWDVYGVEPDAEAAKIAKSLGIKVFNKLEDIKFKNNFFDTITIWNVLEHVYNPTETLSITRTILKRKSDLIMEIPNIDSFAYKLFKNKWFGLDVPRQLYSYSLNTIKKYNKKIGFRIIKVKYNSRTSQFLAPIQFIINEKTGKHNMKLKKNWFLKQCFRPLSFLVNKLHIGDSVIIYLRK